MSVYKWLKKADREYDSSFRRKYQGQTILPGNAFEWHKEAYFTYRIIHSNRQLVWATWVLTLTTIILSILTLYLQYSK